MFIFYILIYLFIYIFSICIIYSDMIDFVKKKIAGGGLHPNPPAALNVCLFTEYT